MPLPPNSSSTVMPEIGGKIVQAIDFGGAWRDLGFSKTANGVAQGQGLCAEIEIELREIHLASSQSQAVLCSDLVATRVALWRWLARFAVQRASA